MSIDVGKCKKLLGEVVAAAITSSKPVQKAAAGAKDAVERLPMPSSSQVLAYHTGFRGKTTAVNKKPFVLTRAVIEDRKKELLQLNDLRSGNFKIPDFEIYHATNLPPKDYKRIKDCLFIKCRGNDQISQKELDEILELSDKKYEMFFELVSIKGRGDKQLSIYHILDFLKSATPEQVKRAKALSYIKGRGEKQLEFFYQIENLSKKSPEQFEQIKKLLFIPSKKKNQLNYDDIIKVIGWKLNKHDFKNLLGLLSHNPEKSTPFYIEEIKTFLSEDKICKRLKELHYIKELGDKQLSFWQIKHYVNLPDFKYNTLKKLLHVDKFKDNQLEYSQIKEILSCNPKKIKKLLSYLNDKDLNIDSDTFHRLLELKDIDSFISIVKQSPNRPPKDIFRLYNYCDKKVFESIKPFLKNSEYDISMSSGWIDIKNKNNNFCFSIYTKNQKNKDYIFEKPIVGGKKETTRIIKTSQGTFIDKGITEGDEISISELNNNYSKLHNFPENGTLEEIFAFMEKGDFKTSKVFEHSTEQLGHAKFSSPQGANTYKNIDGSIISQLDTTKSKDAERVTIHYPDGRIATNDWNLDISTVLEPNKTNSGMRIRKLSGNDTIDLTSSVEGDIVTLTDNLTGKNLKFNIFDIVERDSSSPDDKYINFGERQAEITKLIKTLSPTTILNLLKLKKFNEKIQFPFIKNSVNGYQNSLTITLTNSPQIASHEIFHGITDVLDLTKDSELIRLHKKEANKNKGLISILSSYASGVYYDAERGLHELISIMGTMNEYGAEMSYRGDATRLAFPETTKAIEKKLMEYYKKTIQEFFKN